MKFKRNLFGYFGNVPNGWRNYTKLRVKGKGKDIPRQAQVAQGVLVGQGAGFS
jgi:hypothetical protein